MIFSRLLTFVPYYNLGFYLTWFTISTINIHTTLTKWHFSKTHQNISNIYGTDKYYNIYMSIFSITKGYFYGLFWPFALTMIIYRKYLSYKLNIPALIYEPFVPLSILTPFYHYGRVLNSDTISVIKYMLGYNKDFYFN